MISENVGNKFSGENVLILKSVCAVEMMQCSLYSLDVYKCK